MCSRQISGLATRSFSTPHPIQQEVTLPNNFMLRSISSSVPGFEAGVRLLQGGRRPSTVRSYDQKWIKFETFTTQVLDDTGASRMSALPVSSQPVVAYLGFLLESDTISAKSRQSYLSAIIVVHNVFEYPSQSYRHLVKLVCKGLPELQGSVMFQPQQVTAFPAEHMFVIVQFGSSSSVTFLPRFLLMEELLIRQVQLTVEVSSLHLSNAMEALIELDD
jgi:hypothetical protein